MPYSLFDQAKKIYREALAEMVHLEAELQKASACVEASQESYNMLMMGRHSNTIHSLLASRQAHRLFSVDQIPGLSRPKNRNSLYKSESGIKYQLTLEIQKRKDAFNDLSEKKKLYNELSEKCREKKHKFKNLCFGDSEVESYSISISPSSKSVKIEFIREVVDSQNESNKKCCTIM